MKPSHLLERSFFAVRHWPEPVPLTFVGREIGSEPSGLKAGARLAGLPPTHIVRTAYSWEHGVRQNTG